MRLDSELKERARYEGESYMVLLLPVGRVEVAVIENCGWIWKQGSRIRHP